MNFAWGDWISGWPRKRRRAAHTDPAAATPLRIGLALGGGFARGMAHVGVLRVFEENKIPIHSIAGVSAGAIVAAAYASGATPEEIARAACAMRFTDVARWTIGRMGIAGSERMERFLSKMLKCITFEQMHIPLGVVATDIVTGEAVIFRDRGDVVLPIRASCSYPGIFQPVRSGDRLLVDGAISMEVPALLVRMLGATHVVSLHLPMQGDAAMPTNVIHVLNRCFQILHSRTEITWRQHSDLVIEPDVRGMEWDAFECATELMQAGETAARLALPKLLEWMGTVRAESAEPQPVAKMKHRFG
jgi:NTE family protein